MDAPVTSVDFHFDIMCPWAFQASVWMRDVRDRLGLEVRWCFFSLEEINRAEGKKHPWQREWSYGWSMMRIGALLRRIDPGLLDRWYLAAGTALHVEGRKPHRREVAESLIGQLGLDPALVGQALDDPSTHDEVRADHDRAGVERRLEDVVAAARDEAPAHEDDVRERVDARQLADRVE